jgi:hypothetical protein
MRNRCIADKITPNGAAVIVILSANLFTNESRAFADCLPEPSAGPQQTDERRVQPVGDAQGRASSMSLKSVHGVSAK